MKRLIQRLVMGSIVLIVGAICLKIYTYNTTTAAAAMIDAVNPFVPVETVYVKTTPKYEYKYADSVSKIENFVYVQTCYKHNGQSRKVAYTAFGKRLKPKKYLKLTVKGQNVKKWQEIGKTEVPKCVINQL